MTKQNHPVWINNGTIELDSGEKLTILDGICLEKGCAIELVSGSITSVCPISVTVTPLQTIMPRHIEGILVHGTIKLPRSGRLGLGPLATEVPVRNGAIIRIFMQRYVD